MRIFKITYDFKATQHQQIWVCGLHNKHLHYYRNLHGIHNLSLTLSRQGISSFQCIHKWSKNEDKRLNLLKNNEGFTQFTALQQTLPPLHQIAFSSLSTSSDPLMLSQKSRSIQTPPYWLQTELQQTISPGHVSATSVPSFSLHKVFDKQDPPASRQSLPSGFWSGH